MSISEHADIGPSSYQLADENTDPALYYAQRAVEADPWSNPFREHLVRLLRRRNQRDEAERIVRQGLEMNNSWAEGHRLLAMLLKKKHEYAKALVSARLALDLAPTKMINRNTLTRLLLHNFKFIEAVHVAFSHPQKRLNALFFIVVNGNQTIIKKYRILCGIKG